MKNGRMSKREKFKFYCGECREIHSMPSYCIAQLASGNSLEFQCHCGNTVEIEPEDVKVDG